MKVIETRHLENCFDGSIIKEILLSEFITKEWIYALGTRGTLQYYPNFARPFFKIRFASYYDLKGIQGNNTIRVHLKNPEKFTIDDFITYLDSL